MYYSLPVIRDYHKAYNRDTYPEDEFCPFYTGIPVKLEGKETAIEPQKGKMMRYTIDNALHVTTVSHVFRKEAEDYWNNHLERHFLLSAVSFITLPVFEVLRQMKKVADQSAYIGMGVGGVSLVYNIFEVVDAYNNIEEWKDPLPEAKVKRKNAHDRVDYIYQEKMIGKYMTQAEASNMFDDSVKAAYRAFRHAKTLIATF